MILSTFIPLLWYAKTVNDPKTISLIFDKNEHLLCDNFSAIDYSDYGQKIEEFSEIISEIDEPINQAHIYEPKIINKDVLTFTVLRPFKNINAEIGNISSLIRNLKSEKYRISFELGYLLVFTISREKTLSLEEQKLFKNISTGEDFFEFIEITLPQNFHNCLENKVPKIKGRELKASAEISLSKEDLEKMKNGEKVENIKISVIAYDDKNENFLRYYAREAGVTVNFNKIKNKFEIKSDYTDRNCGEHTFNVLPNFGDDSVKPPKLMKVLNHTEKKETIIGTILKNIKLKIKNTPESVKKYVEKAAIEKNIIGEMGYKIKSSKLRKKKINFFDNLDGNKNLRMHDKLKFKAKNALEVVFEKRNSDDAVTSQKINFGFFVETNMDIIYLIECLLGKKQLKHKKAVFKTDTFMLDGKNLNLSLA